jgi:hypothetical protein
LGDPRPTEERRACGAHLATPVGVADDVGDQQVFEAFEVAGLRESFDFPYQQIASILELKEAAAAPRGRQRSPSCKRPPHPPFLRRELCSGRWDFRWFSAAAQVSFIGVPIALAHPLLLATNQFRGGRWRWAVGARGGWS